MATKKNSVKKTATATKNTTSAEERSIVTVPPILRMAANVRLRGDSLIMHRMSQEEKDKIRAKQTGQATAPRAPKNPEAQFQAAKYLDSRGRDCLRGIAVKKAIVKAARNLDGVDMTQLRGWIFIQGDLIPIHYEECVMREDLVKIGMGKTDLRWRPEYLNWYADVKVEYLANVITASQVINLLQHAGFSVGIHEWRPERDGDHGRFEVDFNVSKVPGKKAA
jgi:hypothetical protein